MKLTLQLQLLPTADQKADLLATMARFNEAATYAAKVGFEAKVYGQVTLHRLCYREIRERFALSSQMAVRAIAKAVECFQRDKTRCPAFKPRSAVCYDQRVLSFKGLTEVSLWAMTGRLRMPFVCGAYQRQRQGRIKGQADLVYRQGKFYLLCTIDLPESAPVAPGDVLGVDLGIVNLATDSDGKTYSGEAVEKVRRRHHRNRRRLQRKGTRGAKKRLRKLSGREAGFRRHQNHVISKAIVVKAKGTDRGIALEDLKGIRDRVTVRRRDRARHAGWSFFQLRSFVEYKARLAGVFVVAVDPRGTSRTCNQCGQCEKDNRPDRDTFRCLHCGYSTQADLNAALNLRARGLGACKRPSELATGPHDAAPPNGQPESRLLELAVVYWMLPDILNIGK
jgi:IS605 OrfB family transposase